MPPSPHQTMSARQWALLLFLSLLWGGSFLFIRIAMQDIGPLTLVFLRTAVAAVVLLLIMRWRGLELPREKSVWGSLAVLGLLNNLLPFSLLFWSEITLSAGVASILNALTPLFAVVLAHYFGTHERITPNRLAGLLCGIGGVGVLIGPGLWSGGGGHGAMQLLAELAVIIASLSYAVAYVIYFRLLVTAGPTNATLVTLLAPVTAVFLGWAVLQEHLQPRHFGGMALIAAGLLAIDGRLLRRLRPIVPPV